MTRIDDLSVGDFIVVSSLPEIEPQQMGPMTFIPMNQNDGSSYIRMNGTPLMIIAIGLPFVGVYDGEHKFAIDIRRIGVQKVSEEYAAIMNVCCDDWEVEEDENGRITCIPQPPKQGKVRNPLTNKPSYCCPRCGSEMKETTTKHGMVRVCQSDGCDYSELGFGL